MYQVLETENTKKALLEELEKKRWSLQEEWDGIQKVFVANVNFDFWAHNKVRRDHD